MKYILYNLLSYLLKYQKSEQLLALAGNTRILEPSKYRIIKE